MINLIAKRAKDSIPFGYWKFFGNVFFLAFFLMAFFLYKERMLFFDTPFFSFKMIYFKDFNIEQGRICDIIPQIIPLYFLKHGCSLELFLRMYSMSFVMIYYLIFIVLAYVLKSPKGTILLLISLCICTRHVFYYPISELSYALALVPIVWILLTLLFDVTISKAMKKRSLFFSACTLLIISYFHPIALIAIPLVAGYEFLNKWDYKNKYFICFVLLFSGWFILRFYIFGKSEYEQDKMVSFTDFIKYLPELKTLPSTKYLILFFRENIKLTLLALLVIFFIAFYQKKFYTTIWWLINTLGATTLILISNRFGESPIMYEKYFLIIGFFIAFIMIAVLEKHLSSLWFYIIATLFILYNVNEIYKSKSVFQKRIEYLNRLADYSSENKKNKLIIHTACYPWQYAWVDWALPFETLLNSALTHPENAMTAITVDSLSRYQNENTYENVFLGPRWAPTWFNAENLDANYFKLSKGLYTPLNSIQYDSIVNDSLWSNKNILFESGKKTYVSDADSFIVVPLEILNNSGKIIPSIRKAINEINFSYHIYDNDGKLLQWDGQRTFLEMDIDKKGSAGIVIDLPAYKGKFYADIDLVTENTRWWGINYRILIERK